jgi:hypothetical protein
VAAVAEALETGGIEAAFGCLPDRDHVVYVRGFDQQLRLEALNTQRGRGSSAAGVVSQHVV